MSTTGHENEAINVQGLKASLQKFKDEYTTDVAYLEEGESSAVIADFDPQTDTVWKKAQTLSNAEKSQVKTNLGLPQEIYSKTEVNNLITTPNQQYVTVATYASLPASGSADTIYRVSNYNGSTSQVDPTMYSEYAWNGTDYEFLCVKSQVGEVFDITAYNSNTKYADLSAALGTNGVNIPESLRKGGMSVKFVQNSDNKYVQYRLMANSFTTNVSMWKEYNITTEQCVDIDTATKTVYIFPIGSGQDFLIMNPCEVAITLKFMDKLNGTVLLTRTVNANNFLSVTYTGSTEINCVRFENATVGNYFVLSKDILSKLNNESLNFFYDLLFKKNELTLEADDVNNLLYENIESSFSVDYTAAGVSKNIYRRIKKGDIICLEVTTASDSSVGNISINMIELNGNEIYIDNPLLKAFNGRVLVFRSPINSRGIKITYNTNETSLPITLSYKISIQENNSNYIAKIVTDKVPIFPIRRDTSLEKYDRIFVVYRNVSGVYGGNQTVRYWQQYGQNFTGIRSSITIPGKIEYTKEVYTSGNPRGTKYNYIGVDNPNNIEMEIMLMTEDMYNEKYPRFPYSICLLGGGRKIISPKYSSYCHNACVSLDKGFTFVIYHSNETKIQESHDDYVNNVFLTILEDGKNELLTKAIFSDFEFVETYDGNDLTLPYNHSIIDKGSDTLLIRCGFKYNGTHIWMYKTFNKSTWEVSDIAPQQLSYNGNTVDWTQANYATMLNTLYGTSYDTSFATDDNLIINMFKYNNTYYMVNCAKMAEGSVDSNTVPFVLLSSSDAITWSPVAKLLDDQLSSEQAIAILNNKLYVVFRPGHQALKYAVFSMSDYSIITQPTAISDSISAKPVTFVYNNKVYALYNKGNNSVMQTNNYYGRTSLEVAYFNDSDVLVNLKQYYNAAGFQYYNVAIRGNIIKFVNTEDNGGVNADVNAGCYNQCSICDIKNEDLVIPSN